MTATITAPRWPTYQHTVTLTAPVRSTTNAGKDCPATLTVVAGLHYLQGNARPYFTVTGRVQRPRWLAEATAGIALLDSLTA